MVIAIFSLTVLGITMGWLLGVAARVLTVEGNPVIEQIVDLLPGSQCGQCGYPGCTPAAEAIASRAAPITICRPGGRTVIEALAKVLGFSASQSENADKPPMIARRSALRCARCARPFRPGIWSNPTTAAT